MANDVLRIRVYLERVRLDAGGYVRKGQAIQSGTYYGVGLPLYHYYAEFEGKDGEQSTVEDEIRADDRQDAINIIKGTRGSYRFPANARIVFSGRY